MFRNKNNGVHDFGGSDADWRKIAGPLALVYSSNPRYSHQTNYTQNNVGRGVGIGVDEDKCARLEQLVQSPLKQTTM
jgi:hypothetical protein